MSKTPETDAKAAENKANFPHGFTTIYSGCHVDADFARTLETQRDEALALMADAIDLLDGNMPLNEAAQDNELLRKMIMHLEAMDNKVKLRRERDEARAEVERLRKRVEELEAHPAFVVDMQTGKFTPLLSTPTQPEIFEAHGREWYRHTGNDCPCPWEAEVRAWLTGDAGESESSLGPCAAEKFDWRTEHTNGDIIGWRPADAPEKLPRK